ncbi:sugar phosphate nucleotidyltransferase [Butyrivibrio sp. XPD2002]|uniref:sugar phosphate nucleotidyltransferase n=1 Tax=Butyrivibrio sp. XPD2002 TaxID=1280665 RepID=UPI00041387C9|nr:sugar phosphate nucleotidyltransferase [Butyrivibrio sp. XPD2002]
MMDGSELPVYTRYIDKQSISISEAMSKINTNASGILFLIVETGVLSACITDGDIRRFLLAGGSMDAPAIDAANKTPKVASSIEEAKNLYHKRNWIAIPIVDNNNRIIDVYTGDGNEEHKKAVLNTPVVINAGGRGTRLDPFTKVLPKPLIPVGELPIIELIMKEYQSYSCNDFHIIVNYKKELMKAYFLDAEKSYNISWYDECEPLGTGGGLSLLRGKMESTFFFANCDALLTANYESMLKFHKENGNVITMICAYKNVNIPYGVVEMGEGGVIQSMKEKPLMSFLTNTGIYIVEPEVIDDIEDDVSVGFPDIVERERQKGKRVAAFPVSENDWMDMGQLSELEKMRVKLYGE